MFLEAAGTRVLVDAGFSCRELEARLAALGVDPAELDAVLLSHEHSDHARGVERFARRFGCAVAATPSTLDCLGLRPGGGLRVRPFENGGSFRLGKWRVVGVPVPHDAADPAAFRMETPEGSVGYALDLGHAPQAVCRLLAGCRAIIVESNHDLTMLEEGPYPRELKQRLRGPRGHLSNGEAAAFISEVATRETRSLVLAHLSRTNNRADLAMLEAHRALGRLSSEIRMTVAEQGPGAHWIEA